MAADTTSARQFVDSLVASLAQSTANEQETILNPLLSADPTTKQALLTLHALFPNDLLPALDILDRRLVLRLCVANGSGVAAAQDEAAQELVRNSNDSKHKCIYYVQSTQQSSKPKWKAADQVAHYEIRLKAWNCSCPAFTFAVLSQHTQNTKPIEAQFGGLSFGDQLPVCKHLLACFLADQCNFDNLVEARNVAQHELAGWAAGWTD